MTLLDLFLTFFRIAFCVLGGGFAIVPMVEHEFVAKRKTMTDEEFADLLAVVQSVPGLMAANSAVYIGMRFRGVAGAAAALAGVALPSIVAILLVACVFGRELGAGESPWLAGAFLGIRAALCGLILSTAWRNGAKTLRSPFAWCLFLVAAFLLIVLKVNPAWVILGGAATGVLRELIRRPKPPATVRD